MRNISGDVQYHYGQHRTVMKKIYLVFYLTNCRSSLLYSFGVMKEIIFLFYNNFNIRIFRCNKIHTNCFQGNGAVQKGMPYKAYHGRTGRVFNVTPHALGVTVNKRVRGKIIPKRYVKY